MSAPTLVGRASTRPVSRDGNASFLQRGRQLGRDGRLVRLGPGNSRPDLFGFVVLWDFIPWSHDQLGNVESGLLSDLSKQVEGFLADRDLSRKNPE